MKMKELDAAGYSETPDFINTEQQFLEALNGSAKNLNLCMGASVIHLLFPLNYIMEWFFLLKTNRK